MWQGLGGLSSIGASSLSLGKSWLRVCRHRIEPRLLRGARETRGKSGKVAVHVAAATDPHDQHEEIGILNLIDNPIITDADSVKAKPVLQGCCAAWSRIVRQPVNFPGDAPTMRIGNFGQRTCRGRLDLDSVGQFSPIAS